MVHVLFLLEVALIVSLVVDAVPRFDADEGGVLAVGTPNAHGGRLEPHGDHQILGVVKECHLVQLAAVDDDALRDHRL